MKNNDDFKTHVKEPRWQQVASVMLVLGFIALWLWLGFR
ncbi:MAG: hypothetical protein QG621_333 [Patescibacteria group bacterium]|jgi:hypothetical protein|nr:hypothetical protein [Patescibacteria group bacterium]